MGRQAKLALKGGTPDPFPGITRAAEAYVEIRDERMELTEREVARKLELLQAMKKHKRTIYRVAGLEIELLPGEDTVKVRKKAAPAEAD